MKLVIMCLINVTMSELPTWQPHPESLHYFPAVGWKIVAITGPNKIFTHLY